MKSIRLPSAVVLAAIACSFASLYAQAPLEDNPVPKLLENIQSENLQVAASAARSLGVVFAPGGKGGDEKGEATTALIDKLASPLGAKLREECARALGRMRSKEALEPIKKAIDDEDVEVAIAAAEAAANILPVDDARVFLKERGNDESENVKAAVYRAMAGIAKPEDAPFMIEGLDFDNWRVQQGAVQGLERSVRFGARIDAEVYDQVANVLGNEIINASNAAVHFLTHIRNDESLRATIAAVDTPPTGEEGDTTWRKRAMALRTVRHWNYPRNEPALPAVIRQLGDPTANVTNEARNILVYLRHEKLVSQAQLFPLLLAELETAESLPLRSGIMREMGGNVERQYASRVAKVAEKTLADAMDDKSQWPARAYSCRLLGASGYTGNLTDIAACVSDNVPNVRNEAGRALAELAPYCKDEQKPEVAAALKPLLDKPDDWRKTAIAARATGYYPLAESVEPLTILLGHSVVNVRDSAADALSRYVENGDEQLTALVKEKTFAEVGSVPASWQYGARVLGTLEAPEAVPLLIPMLQKGDWRTQESASKAVTQIAKDNKLGSKELSDTLVRVAQSEVLQVQDAANQALRALAKE